MKRTELNQQEHDKLVSEIAKARFSSSDGTKTYTNPNGEKIALWIANTQT